MTGIRSDLTGKIFGDWTVISFSHRDKKGEAYWSCACVCGRQKAVRGCQLKNGSSKSCGFSHTITITKEKKLKGEYYISPPIKSLFSIYRGSALRRKLPFSLSLDFFNSIIQEPCEYCGRLPFQIYKDKSSYIEIKYNGIDRVDNTKGYIEDNVVPCCGDCNRAKRTLSRGEFLTWIKLVYNHSIKEKI